MAGARSRSQSAKALRCKIPLFIRRLLLQAAQLALCLLHVLECQLAGLDEMSHNRLCAAAEERQQVVDEAALGGIACNRRAEHVEVADLARALDGLLRLQ